MPRLVVVPATPLLVRGVSGSVDALVGLRDVVRDVLVRELADARGAVVVLGTGATARAGRLRPTLGAVGVADGRIPAVPAPAADPVAWDGTASTGPSVARSPWRTSIDTWLPGASPRMANSP